ncbi:drug resistance transporter, EmrB/QacA subfamily [Fontibacillus panacisegetis]|uniref:Drug resistance transporter, EmrB/QacA subfamily n=1 Tax=Fontibacillus panacisegetis TaxID=670482 RepID=A0A1G7U8U4_9BACL|nr:MDR family MFS transporter [Fontibacillus panacisegetis]SDG43844.1 drug resistance transporter, EmrB/QacA subfamily [Fontibacillus panacisegetis]
MGKILKRSYILTGLLLSTFLAAIEGTVIGPAGPRIVGELGGVELLSWVFTAYLLTMAVATPIFGKISDLYGRKLVFVVGSILFLAGSMLSGLAQSMEQLILFRAIQGIGAGGLTPVTFTIIGDIYSIEERAKVQAWISSVWGISSLVGPLLGGYFVDSLNWRWVFGFNVPFGLLSLFFIMKYFKEDIEKRHVKIDIWGAVTFTVGVTALLFGLATGGGQFAWNSPILIGIMVVAVISLIVFIIVEKNAEEPLVPLKLFRIRDIAYSNLASLVASALLIGLTSYLPLWVQGVLGKNATMSGLVLAPMSISWLLGSVLGSRWIITKGSRYTSLIGMIIIALGAVGMAFMSEGMPIFILLIFNALYGIGFGFSFSVFTVIAQSSVGYDLRGASNALNTFVKSIGQTIGVTVFGTLINLQISARTASTAASGVEVTQDDINNLLSPEKMHLLPPELWNELKHVLGGSLHVLFIVMGVLAVIGVVTVIGLRNKAPGAKEE